MYVVFSFHYFHEIMIILIYTIYYIFIYKIKKTETFNLKSTKLKFGNQSKWNKNLMKI